MNHNEKITVTVRKVSVWNKRVNFDFGKLLRTLAKAITPLFGSPPNYIDAVKESFELGACVGLEEEPSDIAYRLILTSMVNALFDLVLENQTKYAEEYQTGGSEKLYEHPDAIRFIDREANALMETDFALDIDFFEKPKEVSILPAFQDLLEKWVSHFGAKVQEAIAIKNRLPAYFVFALHDEWRRNTAKYEALKQHLDTPFTRATRRALSWERYEAYLQKQADEPVFEEAFSLLQVFIPLRAYFTNARQEAQVMLPSFEHAEESKGTRNVFYLQDKLDAWLADVKRNTKADKLKLLSGGPGSGKSSFVKVWAARLAERKDFYVLYFALHQFNVKEDLTQAIGDSLKRAGFFDTNPLEDGEEDRPHILLFDGLDELTQQGAVGNEVARNFYNYLESTLRQYNQGAHARARVVALVAGRELAIQAGEAQHRKKEQTLHLLPYFVPENEYEHHNRYHDPQKILPTDQRDAWWKQYSAAKGLAYAGLPDNLRNVNLEEITAQPLLNYLVALSIERGKVVFDENTNLNVVYDDLIDSVYERRYGGVHQSVATANIDKHKFKQVLQEIAISAWHGGDARTTTVERIKKRIEDSRLGAALQHFQQDAEKGVIRLLTAFYFRQSGMNPNDGKETFEFTHKSFSEYLIAKRLCRVMVTMYDQFTSMEDGNDAGWSEQDCLEKWFEIAHQAEMDGGIERFVRWEIALKEKEEALAWQRFLDKLIGYTARKGYPVGKERRSYREEQAIIGRTLRNLFLFRNACFRRTEEPTPVDWGNEEGFWRWLGEFSYGMKEASLVGGNGILGGILFQEKSFKSGFFRGYMFYSNVLEQVDFQFCTFQDCYFSQDRARWIRFSDSVLKNTIFDDVYFGEVSFESAYLNGGTFFNGRLEDANFSNAILRNITFIETKLERANFRGAKFHNVRFLGVTFIECENLTIEQLKNCKEIRDCEGLPEEMLEVLRRDCPHILM